MRWRMMVDFPQRRTPVMSRTCESSRTSLKASERGWPLAFLSSTSRCRARMAASSSSRIIQCHPSFYSIAICLIWRLPIEYQKTWRRARIPWPVVCFVGTKDDLVTSGTKGNGLRPLRRPAGSALRAAEGEPGASPLLHLHPQEDGPHALRHPPWTTDSKKCMDSCQNEGVHRPVRTLNVHN